MTLIWPGEKPSPAEEDIFKEILPLTLDWEGGYTVDSGGPTNKGITQNTLDSYTTKYKLPQTKVEDLDDTTVEDIYRKEYFEGPKINELPKKVSASVFDYGVNSGPRAAIKSLQSIVGADPDGLIGPQTKEAVQKYIDQNGEESLVEAIYADRGNRYKKIIENNPSKYKKYEGGWFNRIKDLKQKHLDLSFLNPFKPGVAEAAEPEQPIKIDLQQEDAFQKWYSQIAKQNSLNPNPDDVWHFYDYRAYFRAMQEGKAPPPKYMPEHKQYRMPDTFKLPGHPDYYTTQDPTTWTLEEAQRFIEEHPAQTEEERKQQALFIEKKTKQAEVAKQDAVIKELSDKVSQTIATHPAMQGILNVLEKARPRETWERHAQTITQGAKGLVGMALEGTKLTTDTGLEEMQVLRNNISDASEAMVDIGIESYERTFHYLPANLYTRLHNREPFWKSVYESSAPLRQLDLNPEERLTFFDVMRHYQKDLNKKYGLPEDYSHPDDKAYEILGGLAIRVMMPDVLYTGKRIITKTGKATYKEALKTLEIGKEASMEQLQKIATYIDDARDYSNFVKMVRRQYPAAKAENIIQAVKQMREIISRTPITSGTSPATSTMPQILPGAPGEATIPARTVGELMENGPQIARDLKKTLESEKGLAISTGAKVPKILRRLEQRITVPPTEGKEQIDGIKIVTDRGAMPGEPLQTLGNKAALIETEEGKFYIQRADESKVYNPKTKSALFDNTEDAWNAYKLSTPTEGKIEASIEQEYRVAFDIGGKVYEGKPGEIHAQLLDRLPKDIQEKYYNDVANQGFMSGFVSKEDGFQTRGDIEMRTGKVPNVEIVNNNFTKSTPTEGKGEEQPAAGGEIPHPSEWPKIAKEMVEKAEREAGGQKPPKKPPKIAEAAGPEEGEPFIPRMDRPGFKISGEEQERVAEEAARNEAIKEGQDRLKGLIEGTLNTKLKEVGEYASLKHLPWLFSDKGKGADDLVSVLQREGFLTDEENSDSDVLKAIQYYFSEDILKKAEKASSTEARQYQRKMKYKLAHPGKAKVLKQEIPETGVGRGTLLNTREDTDYSEKNRIISQMPFTLLGNKAEVLARLTSGLKNILRRGIEEVYDLFGGAKGYRVGLFSMIDGKNYHLNELSDERNTYYRNLQDPGKVQIMKDTVDSLRDGLLSEIARAFNLKLDTLSPNERRRAMNKWLSRDMPKERYLFAKEIIQKYGDRLLTEAQTDRFASPESSAKYFFLENTSIFGISKDTVGYHWTQGIIRTTQAKSEIRDNMRRLENVGAQFSTELKRDKDIEITQENAWEVMDQLTKAITEGKKDPLKISILVDPQYLNPSEVAGTYSVGSEDTKWEGHKKNLETHLLPLIRTGVRIIYTNNEDINLTKWLKQNNLPYNIEEGIGAVAERGGRDEIISFINYEIPEKYTNPASAKTVGYEPGEITGESPEFEAWIKLKREVEGLSIEKENLIRTIKAIATTKRLSGATVSRVKQALGINNWKLAKLPQLKQLKDYLETFKEGDRVLSEQQLLTLHGIINDIVQAAIIPKRILIDQLGEKKDIMEGLIVGRIDDKVFPSVDIKEGHPLVARIVNQAENKLEAAENTIEHRDQVLGKLLARAEKSRKLKVREHLTRFLAPQNPEIFKALGGESVDLTLQERAVVAYLKNFFRMAKNQLQLVKYRKHYIPHLQKPLMEKIMTEGVIAAIKEILNPYKREYDIPINIMLELDDIIGSTKFFKFALPRQGYGKPTTNIRSIVHAYSRLFETKMVLDEILPQGQTISKLLLHNRAAMWMKNYLQNLKGRGLDHSFRTGKMAWVVHLADWIVDLSYLKLLSLNWKSALKNIMAGEVNSWIFTTTMQWLTGKRRMALNPKKAFHMAKEYGILEGTYAGYSQVGIGRLKPIQRLAMIGQSAGEWEIRGSLFVSQLTDEEWSSGVISDDRKRKLKDVVAITQGIFSKAESPLWVQTWWGRMMMQMNRWRITNAMMMRRLANGARNEWIQGIRFGKNTRSLAKAFIAYGVGMYLNYQLGKAGYKKAAQIAQAMAEDINSLVELVTLRPIVDAIKNNPTISMFSEFAYDIQNLAVFLRVPGVQKPKKMIFQHGLKETYIAPIEQFKTGSQGKQRKTAGTLRW